MTTFYAQRDASKKVAKSVEEYEVLFTEQPVSNEDAIRRRKNEYNAMVNDFYNLVTDFYSYGWGDSFHFAPRWKTESFTESIKRSEHALAAAIGLNEDSCALDVGCGIGGPMREMAIFSGYLLLIAGPTLQELLLTITRQIKSNLQVN